MTRRLNTQEESIYVAGILLLCWLLFESAYFLYSGRLMDLARMLPQYFQNRITVGLYVVYHLTISTIGALAVVPLMLKGQKAGLILGLAYCLSGPTVSPFEFILSADSLLAPGNKPTLLSQAIDIIWIICMVSITVLFFLQRRAARDT